MRKEIWFRGYHWGPLMQWWPIHWKGYATLVGAIGSCILLSYASDWMPTGFFFWPWLALAGVIALTGFFIARHTDWNPRTFLD